MSIVRPNSADWHGARGSILDQADDLRELADALSSDVIVIDSAAMASGADPLKPEAPIMYGKAIQRIGRPALTIAHVSKTADHAAAMTTPFGSVFWHNLARVTWSLSPQGEDAGHVVLLTCRKANGYQRPGRELLTVTYDDRGIPRDVMARSYALVVADRIEAALDAAGEPLTVAQIVDAMKDDGDPEPVKAGTVRTTLTRELSKGRPPRWTVTGTGKAQRWGKA
jgi:hypothetical protein